MNNTLLDLNNYLFGQMERLDDPDLSEESLTTEIKRAKAMKDIGQVIVNNAKVVLDATKFNDDRMDADHGAPRILIGD